MGRDTSFDWHFQVMLLDLLEKLGIKQAAPKDLTESFLRDAARPVSVDDTKAP